MLGNLVTWLRMLDYDTLYARDLDDKEIIKLAEAEQRIILTRDEGLARDAKKRSINCHLLRSLQTREQIRELHNALNINLEPKMQRCSLCNASMRPAVQGDMETIKSREYVPKNIDARELWLCTACGQVYWEGGHWKKIRETLKIK